MIIPMWSSRTSIGISQGFQQTDRIGEESFGPFEHDIGNLGIIGVRGPIAGLIMLSNPLFGALDEPESGGFPEQVSFCTDCAFRNLGDMLQILLDLLPSDLHGVLEALDDAVPE